MDIEAIYQRIIEQNLKEGEALSLDYPLEPSDAEALAMAHPDIFLKYSFWKNFVGGTNVFCTYGDLSLFSGHSFVGKVHGLEKAMELMLHRCDTIIEPGFYFLIEGVDLGRFSDNYELSDYLYHRLLSQGEKYLPFISGLGGVTLKELVSESGTDIYLAIVHNEYFDEIDCVEPHQAAVEAKTHEIADLLFEEDMPAIIKTLLAYNYIGYLTNYSTLDKTAELWDLPLGIHTPYACLIEHSCVCDAFAKTLRLLLGLGGVESHVVFGQAKRKDESHTWNVIRIGDDYYHADLTWDDEDGYSGHYFFLRSDACFAIDHEWESADYHKCEKERDFAKEIEVYLENNKQRLLGKGIPEEVLTYRYSDINSPAYTPFNRLK